ncbi:MAG: amidohydrolase family protein [Bacteroidetes bacterium]|nr:amidohydrolase family protein [Bacteroidota bacterium]
MKKNLLLALLSILIIRCSGPVTYDVLIRNGDIYDGSGNPHFKADIGINADTIAAIGDLTKAIGKTEIDATGLAVAPGFINMLSWANESLIEDGRSQGDIRQGVTLEVLGEGDSMGPLNDLMKEDMKRSQSDIKFDISWTSLGEYLDFLVKKGVSTNVASFIGTATVRIYTVGYDDRPPNPSELDTMKLLVRQAMEEGAVGVSSALQYVPASFAKPDELEALAAEAKAYDGMYITHVRDEGVGLLPAIDEAIDVAGRTGVRTEIYHLKQSGRASWEYIDDVIRKIDSARSAGLHVTADMYNYIASSTGFDIVMPAWVQEGGFDKWKKRLMDPVIRRRIAPEIRKSLMERTGSAEKVMVIGFSTDSLKYLTGKTLAEIAAMRKKSPEETIMDLVIDDNSRIGVVYFSMSEENVKRQIALPWMAFCSDGGSYSTEGVFLKFSTHPRAYGNFARLLGKYVRDEKVITLEEAVRKLSEFPATNLRLDRRGSLKKGYYADVVAFDQNIIRDNATFEKPHQYAIGMEHVLVNGVPVIKDGDHTGATPGQVVRGPGWVNK